MGKNVLFSNKLEKKTYEGGKAYASTFEDKLCTIFTLGMLNNRFYDNAQDIVNDMDDIFREALIICPELATKYAVYSAEVLRMKLMPTVWLVYVSTLNDKTLFKKAFPRIIGTNIKMLHDFCDICRKTTIRPGGHQYQKIRNTNRGIGSSLKKTINAHLNNIMNDYNVTRFTGKLEDICHLTRIKDTNNTKAYLQYIFKPKNQKRRLTFKRAKVLQETIDILSGEHNEEDLQKALDNIKKAHIQMDEIKFTFGNLNQEELKKVYLYFVPTLSYAALISNLVAIERVFATSSHVEETYNRTYGELKQVKVDEVQMPNDFVKLVANRIEDVNAYKKSGLFFLRLYAASKMVLTTEWYQALNNTFKKVANEVFSDVPDTIKMKCSADTSGSMSTSITNNIDAEDIAAYMTAACTLSIKGCSAYATATITKQVKLRSDNIEICAEDIRNTETGYGTNFETLLKNYNNENIILLITDCQQSDNVYKKWKNLNKPENAKFIIWDVVGYYGRNVISETDPSFLYIRGFSDRTISTVSNLILGKAGQKEIVHSIEL